MKSLTLALVALFTLTACGDDGPSRDQLCAIAQIEGHDYYYAANCID